MVYLHKSDNSFCGGKELVNKELFMAFWE